MLPSYPTHLARSVFRPEILRTLASGTRMRKTSTFGVLDSQNTGSLPRDSEPQEDEVRARILDTASFYRKTRPRRQAQLRMYRYLARYLMLETTVGRQGYLVDAHSVQVSSRDIRKLYKTHGTHLFFLEI